MTLYKISNIPEPNSDLHSHLNFDDKDGRYYRPQSCQPTWKHQYQIYSTILWEHNILIYRILNAEFNIVLLHWNKQHSESGIIKWRCRLLNCNFHLVLMFTWFRSMQICVGLNIESSGLQDWPALAFEADICTRWKGIPVQWFSEFYFYFFLRILAIDVVFFIDVIDLSHQIIEFSKNRDDGYYKMLIWSLKDERYKPFPALALSKNSVSSGNRGRALFRTKQNLLPRNWPSVTSMYAEIAKLTK